MFSGLFKVPYLVLYQKNPKNRQDNSGILLIFAFEDRSLCIVQNDARSKNLLVSKLCTENARTDKTA
jgi:hypothetical protein